MRKDDYFEQFYWLDWWEKDSPQSYPRTISLGGINRYVEVFGGAGWVLFGKEQLPGQEEVFNDLNGDLINLYRCIKYHCNAVQDELDLLLTSREQFFDYFEQINCRELTDVQRAARFFYLIKISFGSNCHTFGNSARNIEYAREYLKRVQDRLKGVVIECKDFEHLIKVYDKKDTLFYLDPPYVGTEKYYKVLFTLEDHQKLADILKEIEGKFILSYNDDPIIHKLYDKFNIERIVRNNFLSGNGGNKVPFAELIIRNY